MLYKPIPKKGYEDFNEISNTGIVRRNNRILSQHIRNGYKAISLYNKETKKSLTVNVHRMVALTFLDNPNNYKFVNHIDGNKLNNNYTNLEWVSAKQNTSHAIKTGLTKPHIKPVDQYTKDGIFIKSYPSIKEASLQTNSCGKKISAVCKGQRKTTNGFIWKYQIDEEKNIEPIGIIIEEFPNYILTEEGTYSCLCQESHGMQFRLIRH